MPPNTHSPSAEEFWRRYELIKVIAEGGFGTVWSGRDREKVRRRAQVVKVAIKIVALQGSDDLKLVHNEVDIHAKLFASGESSPLLVRLHDAIFEEERALLVLDLVEGLPLRDCIDAAPRARLPEALAAPVVRQLASALAFMHAKQVAHLDVKPDNVLISGLASGQSNGGAIRLRLIDYGSACAMDSHGFVQDAGGTDLYMAPERLALPSPRSRYPGASADVYSLGGVVLHMLLGCAAAEAAAAKAAAMGKAAEAATGARVKAGKANAAAKTGARAEEATAARAQQLAQTMAKAAESAAAAAGSAAALVEANIAELDVRPSAPAMTLLLAATRVEPGERPTAAELLQLEWLLERKLQHRGSSALMRTSNPALVELEAALPEIS